MYKSEVLSPRPKGLILSVHTLIILILVGIGILYAQGSLNLQTDSLFYSGCVFFSILTLWFFWSWYQLTNRLFDPYLLFLTSAVLFNGGQMILEVFHLNSDGFLSNSFPESTTLSIVYLVVLSMACLHLGAMLSVASASHAHTAEDLSQNETYIVQNRHNLYFVGRILFYIATIPTFIVLRNAFSVVLSGGYGALYEQETPHGIGSAAGILAYFIFPGTYFIIAAGKRATRLRNLSTIGLILYSGARFFLGTRGSAIMPLLALMWLWNSLVQRIPKTLMFGFALLMVCVIFPLVAQTRSQTGADRLSLELLMNTFNAIDNPAIASISEMGGSMRTIGWTMELVPNVRPFALGMTYLTGILILIPNVFTEDRHPALTISGYDIPDFWLVWEIEPEFAQRGGSFGFSFIAEAYLNFGWAAPLFLGLLGFCYGKFVNWAVCSRDPAKMAVSATFVSFFLFYARGAFEMVVRPFIWYSMFPYLWVRFLSSSKTRSAMGSKE